MDGWMDGWMECLAANFLAWIPLLGWSEALSWVLYHTTYPDIEHKAPGLPAALCHLYTEERFTSENSKNTHSVGIQTNSHSYKLSLI